MAPRTLNRHLGELTAYGYVSPDKKKKHSAGYLYTVASDAGNDLPKVIAEQIAQVMDRVKAAAEHRFASSSEDGDRARRTPAAAASNRAGAG